MAVTKINIVASSRQSPTIEPDGYDLEMDNVGHCRPVAARYIRCSVRSPHHCADPDQPWAGPDVPVAWQQLIAASNGEEVHEGSLNIIYFARWSTCTEGIPSWSPDWTSDNNRRPLGYTMLCRASPDSWLGLSAAVEGMVSAGPPKWMDRLGKFSIQTIPYMCSVSGTTPVST